MHGSECDLVSEATDRSCLKGATAYMKTIMTIVLFTIVCESTTAQAPRGERSREPKEGDSTYALVVSGINKDPEERQIKDKAVADLRRFFLSTARLNANRLNVLVDSNSSVRGDSRISTAANLKETLKSLAAAVEPSDRFIFYYAGQANIVAGKLRLNLPGTDITHEQLGEWVSEIKPSSMLIVLDCPGAGLAVKALAGQNRIIIGACTADQRYSTRFSGYFVPALADNDCDTDGDGRVSLLEAFTAASKQLDDLYRQQGLLRTETPVLEDNADGIPSRQPWRYERDPTDGQAASTFFLSGK